MTFIKIAIRNIFRNKRRSLITISAVGFGLGALIFIWAFVDGAHKQMIENYTSLITGHIQIHKKGFQQQPKLEAHIEHPSQLLSFVEKNPQVQAVSFRVKADGLASSAESSSGVLIVGVDPRNETKISSLPRRIKTGVFLPDDVSKDAVIGKDLAKNLNLQLNDKLVLMSQALDGSIAAGAFYVRGLLDTGAEEIDKGLVLIPLKAAQELFVLPDKVSELTIKIKSGAQSEVIAKSLVAGLNNPMIEILPWQEVSPMLKQWIEFDNAFIWIIVIIVMIVIAIGILNTVLMGVLERTREFGILLALGTKQNQVVVMVALESTFLGILGSLVGIALGLGLAFYFGKVGINLAVFSSALNSFYMDSFIYPIVHYGHMAFSLFLVLLTSISVSVYPAWHAANLKPVEAIRSI